MFEKFHLLDKSIYDIILANHCLFRLNQHAAIKLVKRKPGATDDRYIYSTEYDDMGRDLQTRVKSFLIRHGVRFPRVVFYMDGDRKENPDRMMHVTFQLSNSFASKGILVVLKAELELLDYVLEVDIRSCDLRYLPYKVGRGSRYSYEGPY